MSMYIIDNSSENICQAFLAYFFYNFIIRTKKSNIIIELRKCRDSSDIFSLNLKYLSEVTTSLIKKQK